MDKIEEKLWKKVERWKFLFKFVPFLRKIYVCNSLSFGLVDEKSDIDLFVVTKNGRLFTARAVLTLILQVFGLRRHGRLVAGRFCLSFFADESMADLKGLYIKDDVYGHFWKEKLKLVYERNGGGGGSGGGKFGDFIEGKLRKWQMVRAEKKAALIKNGLNIVIGEHVLKFHNNDIREKVRDEYRRIVKDGYDYSKFISVLASM